MATKYLVTSGADNVSTFASITDWLNSFPTTMTALEALEVPNASFDITAELVGSMPGILNAKVTTSAFYPYIYAAPANGHGGRPRALSGSGARFVATGSTNAWTTTLKFFRMDGIELYQSGTGHALDLLNTVPAGSDIRFTNCLIHDIATGSGYTVYATGTNLNLDLTGSIIYGYQRTIDSRGATSITGVNVLAWRHNAELGLVSDSELNLKNSYSGHAGAASEDYWSGGAPTGNNNASSDTTATARYTSSINSIAGSAVFVSVTPGAEDFNLLAGTNALVDAGVTVSGRTADARGTTIPQGAAPDIGALERIASDVTAPTLTSPTGTQTGSTTASGSVTTDEANGTLYSLATTNATETAATVKASGATQAITSTGSKSVAATSLTASTVYYFHYVHRDAAGNDSTVSNSASFTTAAATPAPTAVITSIVADGDSVTISGTTTDTPTSGLATITAGSGGAVTQGPTAITLGSGTFTVTFAGVVAGTYSGETVSVTNAGGTASATGSAAFTIVAVSGSPESPPPVDGNAYPTAPGTIANIGGIVGVAIAPVNVSAVFADGDALTYSASPAGTAWPAGLVINSATGIISGTVAAVSTTAGLKVRATDTVTQAVDSNAFTVTIAAVVVAAPYVAGVGSTRVAAALNYADFGVADKKSLTFLFGDLVDDLERIRAAQAALCAKLDANHGAATDHAVTIAIPVTSMKVGK